MRYRAGFAYVDGVLPDGEVLQLCRLRYVGSATRWGFALCRASHDDYEDNVLPSGSPTGTVEEALDCVCGLYLDDPTAWMPGPRRFNGGEHWAAWGTWWGLRAVVGRLTGRTVRSGICCAVAPAAAPSEAAPRGILPPGPGRGTRKALVSGPTRASLVG